MKAKEDLQDLIDQIRSEESPVGMDAVYVHALILDKLQVIEERLTSLENKLPDPISEENVTNDQA